jgi:dienelactone hydrolase
MYLVEYHKYFRIDTDKIYLCGFSMGADIALLSASIIDNIAGIISIDPWNGKYVLSHKTEDELKSYIKNLEQRPCIKIESGLKFVDEIMNDQSLDLELASKNNKKPILHIFSDNVEMNNYKRSCKIENDSYCLSLQANDHSFSNKRIALTNTLFNWLEKIQYYEDQN